MLYNFFKQINYTDKVNLTPTSLECFLSEPGENLSVIYCKSNIIISTASYLFPRSFCSLWEGLAQQCGYQRWVLVGPSWRLHFWFHLLSFFLSSTSHTTSLFFFKQITCIFSSGLAKLFQLSGSLFLQISTWFLPSLYSGFCAHIALTQDVFPTNCTF